MYFSEGTAGLETTTRALDFGGGIVEVFVGVSEFESSGVFSSRVTSPSSEWKNETTNEEPKAWHQRGCWCGRVYGTLVALYL